MEPKLLAAKLLALAIDQAGKPEGELAREKAEELILRFGISRHDLSAAEARDLVRQSSLSIPVEGWAQELLGYITYFCACVTIRSSKGEALIFGRNFHIDVATLYNEQVLRQLDEGFRSISGSGLWPVEEVNDWRASFVLGVGRKLESIMDGASTDPFLELRAVCVEAACSVLTDQFPNSVRLASYSRKRQKVQSAFESGTNIEVLSGISALVVGLLSEAPDPERDEPR